MGGAGLGWAFCHGFSGGNSVVFLCLDLGLAMLWFRVLCFSFRKVLSLLEID